MSAGIPSALPRLGSLKPRPWLPGFGPTTHTSDRARFLGALGGSRGARTGASPRRRLLVSTIGDWAPEAALNAWRLDRAAGPDLVFGWTEPRAVAGHAVGLVSQWRCVPCVR